jgi:hypothetical protein
MRRPPRRFDPSLPHRAAYCLLDPLVRCAYDGVQLRVLVGTPYSDEPAGRWEGTMNRVRMITEVTVRDLDAAMDVFTRAAKVVEDSLPSVLAWEIFVDEGHESAVMYEEFNDENALLEYETKLIGLGYRDELLKHAELDRILVLGPVSDTGLLRQLGHAGAILMSHTVGAHR